MHSMQVRATQLQDATAAQLEVMRTRARELRLRTSDLQAREQQLRELRYQTPAGPERTKVEKRWLNARHDATAATIELEGLNERIGELRTTRDQARALTLRPPPVAQLPPVEVRGLANAGIAMVILFIAPILILLVYRLWTRGSARDPLGLEASPRLQRMEQAIELIAMEVERIAEGQQFTTRILAERQPDSAHRVQAAPRQEPDTITPH
jgi:hypothetical protein